MPTCRFRCGCGWKFEHRPCFWVKCPRCQSVSVVWVNFAEVMDWLMQNDPEYRRSYRQEA